MFELMKTGGYMMIPLLLTSIIGVAIIIERLIMLRKNRILPKKLLNTISRLKSREDFQNLRNICVSQNSPLPKLIIECIDNSELSREELKDYMEDQGRHGARELQRGLGALEAIGGTAPLMGLLGTIFGMIKVFQTINEMGVGQTKALSGGISEALVTTATGLVIAIPILLIYYYLNSKAEDFILQIEKHLILIIHKLKDL
ncbi:MAG: MotA/TolQ/ExbB proton channel family protein [Calditrichia bacterium]|nr:MotA/TolQ/ExbB proton channel family protein [Calditrichia bacterium]